VNPILADPIARPGFWRTQFGPYETGGQTGFDYAFGVVLPIACFVADPIVFKTGGFWGDTPVLGNYRLIAYFVSAVEIAVLLFWLLLRRHLTPFSAPIAGVLLAGGIFSTVIGLVILPFSIIGLTFGIGLAGFTPFLTGLVYLRNGARAMRAQLKNSLFGYRFLIAVLAAVLVIGTPVLVSMQLSQAISSSVATFLNGDPVQSAAAANQLRSLSVIISESNLTPMVRAYETEVNAEKKASIKQVYSDVTGDDIEKRMRIMND
jgi:hypothetical protein